MNIVQINNTDLPGARFNGYNLQKNFNSRGISTKQLVYEKLSNDENVITFSDSVNTSVIYREFENEHSIKSIVFPYAHKIMKMKEFVDADIVHYHLIHNYILSILDFPKLVSLKKSVWTIHDPWVFTGHCIYPMDCRKYLSGCECCENLDRNFSMLRDNAAYMWDLKKRIFNSLDIDIVVASKWMKNLIDESPITKSLKRIHIIPFGINLEKYKVDDNRKNRIRKKLGITQDEIVLFFRADRSVYKGLDLIKDMLDKLDVRNHITLLTVGEAGLLNRFRLRYKVKDFGWLNNEDGISDLYASADIFLMPSTAEAFGVMAIEAMASSVPVIVMEGTALPDVVDAPRCGMAFHKNDINDFVYKVELLINNENERIKRGKLCRELAESKYDENTYFDTMLDLYQNIIKRK
ncbi:MAG: glycosyltransferase [Phascolarctobacterium sp.]|uniref:glycosyltransferase n=1 Tax=Phascolarctobacterium sp. TaxID=2049039 RepID=UPI0026DC5E06|nr:glycosyltransferase [Phascolarctobacterium sp.]MDO4921401.1 glycosyltransferase [Phascolarctobacterium sp.]